MMVGESHKNGQTVLLQIILWGSLWGICEVTAGYLLHLLSFHFSWLFWYPVACFFMANVYRQTKKASSVIFVGFLCASIKLLNLLLPGRIDRVINPAISIVFEALTMAAVISAVRLFQNRRCHPVINVLVALGMNTGWRVLFALYLLFLVPGWIRDVSVVSRFEKFIPFFVTQNLITTLLIFIGYQYKHCLLRPITAIEKWRASIGMTLPPRIYTTVKISTVALLLIANIALELVL